ncbi:DNA-binding protein [Cronobacter turicensis]
MDLISKAIEICGKAEAKLIQLQSRAKAEVATNAYDILAPKCINDENLQEYFRALKFALSKKDVRNIAVTGNYGAGKSTVISSYMKFHSNEQYINVSLAGFEMAENENRPPLTNQEVELSILQQILYKENRDALPDSRIDRILNRSWFHTVKTYFSLIKIVIPATVLLGIVFFDKVSAWLKFPGNWAVILNEHYIIKVLAITGLALISLFFITQTASRIGIFDKKIRLGKIAFLSGNMEVKENESSSLLNNCLDEIVYFFSRCQYKIVIFEDLDRLGTPEIFVKLREINKIINNNRTHKTPIRFIYAVRDDMFLDVDGRTKFFDFILPVIPFMDSRNALSLLKNKTPSLSQSNEKHLKNIAFYIKDMRSLINIVNEFNTFSQVVDNGKNAIKLFALVFYKNIYAQDYHLADKKSGLLYSFIHNYRTQKLHAEYFESLDNKLEALFEHAGQLENEIATTPEDIRKDIVTKFVPELLWGMIYIAAKHTHNNSYQRFDSAQLVRDEDYFISLLNNNRPLYVGYSDQYGNPFYAPISNGLIKNFITSYHQRLELLGEDKNTSLRSINHEIRILENKIRARNAIPLDELIRAGGREKFETTAQQYLDNMKKHEFLSEEQLKVLRTDMQYGGLDALYVLLSDGLIMQDFMSYRSIFHEGSLTVNDNDYIKALGQDLGCETANQEFYIDDVEKVISELIEQNRIYSDGALHHQLLTHILDHNYKCFTVMAVSLFGKTDLHIYKVFEVLSLKFVKPEVFDEFIVKSLRISDYLERMLGVLRANHELPSCKSLSIAVLSLTSPEKDEEILAFRDYIHFLGSHIIHAIPDNRLQPFLGNIKKAQVCYDILFTPVTPGEFTAFRYIADNRLYQITLENVSNIIYACLAGEHPVTVEEARRKPWTLIEHHGLSPLISYYLDNIDVFVQTVFVWSDEDSDCIKQMLTENNLNDYSKGMIIREMNFTLSGLSGLFSESPFSDGTESLSLPDLLFQYDRIIPGWPVLLDYLTSHCHADILHQWLTKHADNLGRYNSEADDPTRYTCLYEKIICNNSFDENTYSSILATVDVGPDQIDEQLSSRNFIRLIGMRKIQLNADTYKTAEELYDITEENLTDGFISWFSQFSNIFMNDPDFYLRRTKDTTFFETTLNRLMSSRSFTDETKAQLVIHFTDYYRDNNVSALKLPHTVVILAMGISNDLSFNALLLAALISGGYRNKSKIAELCTRINEPDLSNVFLKRTRATITAGNADIATLILEQSREAGIIRYFEIREDGKMTVTINRETGEDE